MSQAVPILFAWDKQASTRQLCHTPHVASRIFLAGTSGNTREQIREENDG